MNDGIPPTNGPVRETDELFRALSHQYRRSIIQVLQQSQSMGLSELAETIAQRRHEEPPDELTSQEVAAIKTELYHTHVPMLIDVELIKYTEKQNITISDQADANVHLETLSKFE